MHELGVAILRAVMRRLRGRSALRRFITVASALHLAMLRASGGRLGRRLGLTSATILVLTTTGRRTNLPRRVPLLALQDGASFVIAASYGGLDVAPGWFHNLVALPEAVVEIDGRRQRVRAEPVPEEDRGATWARFVRAFPGYADYQARTRRRIPLLVLRPAD